MAAKQLLTPEIQEPESRSKQLSLIDLTAYSIAELTGSHCDDFEDSKTVRARGRKSKCCPTWDMTDSDFETHRLSYLETTQRIIAEYPPVNRIFGELKNGEK